MARRDVRILEIGPIAITAREGLNPIPDGTERFAWRIAEAESRLGYACARITNRSHDVFSMFINTVGALSTDEYARVSVRRSVARARTTVSNISTRLDVRAPRISYEARLPETKFRVDTKRIYGKFARVRRR